MQELYQYTYERHKPISDVVAFDSKLKYLFRDCNIEGTSGSLDENGVWHITVYAYEEIWMGGQEQIRQTIEELEDFEIPKEGGGDIS